METPLPPLGDFIISHSEHDMNRKQLNILLFALVVLNLLDGDFAQPSILDAVKLVLLAVCIYLNNRKE